MLRIIVRTDDANQAAYVGGIVHATVRIFDIEAPEVERFLREPLGNFAHRQVLAVSLTDEEAPDE